MTTIAVVKKAGQIAIAADTLTKWGPGKESAAYIVNHTKLLQVGESWLAVSGNATFKHVLDDWFAHPTRKNTALRNTADIFTAWQKLHKALKDDYYLRPEEQEEDALESSRMDVLIANPWGIFGVSGMRTVQEYARFYAYGSGTEIALGALFAAYDLADRDAESLARLAIEAAAEFDDGTGLPIETRVIDQQP
jgi:ATP-dependent protease HslVU (ClpYQ) peptidase subunit